MADKLEQYLLFKAQLVDEVTKPLEKLEKRVQGLTKGETASVALGGAIGDLTGVFEDFIDQVMDLQESVNEMIANAASGVIPSPTSPAAVGRVVGGGSADTGDDKKSSFWDSLKKSMAQLPSNIGKAVKGAFAFAGTVAKKAKEAALMGVAVGRSVGNVMKKLIPGGFGIGGLIGNALAPIFDLLNAILMPIFQPLQFFLMELVMKLMPLVQKLMPHVLAIMGKIADVVFPLVDAFVQFISEALEPTGKGLGKLGDFFKPIIEAVMELVSAALPLLRDLFYSLVEGLKELLPSFSALVVDIIGVMKEILPPVVDVLKTLWKEALVPLIEVLMDLFKQILPPLKEAFLAIVAAVKPVIKALMPLVRFIVDTLGKVLGTALKGIGWVFRKVADNVGGVVDWMKEKVHAMRKWLPEFLGGYSDEEAAEADRRRAEANAVMSGEAVVVVPEAASVESGVSIPEPTIASTRVEAGTPISASRDRKTGSASVDRSGKTPAVVAAGQASQQSILASLERPTVQPIDFGEYGVTSPTLTVGDETKESLRPSAQRDERRESNSVMASVGHKMSEATDLMGRYFASSTMGPIIAEMMKEA